MTRFPTSLAAGAAAFALLVAACGGDDDRISASELSEVIQEDGDDLTAEQADCVAEAFVESDISDEGLETIVDNPNVEDVEDLDLSDDDTQAATAVVEESIAECFGVDPSATEGDDGTATTEGG